MAKTEIIEVTCKKCNGAKFIGKGKKQPCPKCLDPVTGQPTGKFKKEVEKGSVSL